MTAVTFAYFGEDTRSMTCEANIEYMASISLHINKSKGTATIAGMHVINAIKAAITAASAANVDGMGKAKVCVARVLTRNMVAAVVANVPEYIKASAWYTDETVADKCLSVTGWIKGW